MKKLAIGLLLITLSIPASAQQKTIDSLKKATATAKDDTSRIMAIYRLGFFFKDSKPDTSLLLAQRVVQLSKTAGFQKGETLGLRLQGIAYLQMGNYPKALGCFLAGLKISQQTGNIEVEMKSLANIGLVYTGEGDYRQAINYELTALSLARASHNERTEATVLMDLGDTYEKLGLPDSARVYGRQALPIAFKLKNNDLLGIALNNLGNVYIKLRQTDSALVFYRRSIPYSKLAADDDNICETTLGMAKGFRQLGLQDSSLYYARQSIAAGWHGGFIKRVLDASQFLTSCFRQQGRLDSAFHYQEVSIAAKDSLYSQQKTRDFQNLEFAERQRQQDLQEQQTANRARIRYYLLIAVIVFLVVLAVVFWRNNKRNKKAKTQIQHTLDELKTTQNQLVQSAKMASLGELTAGIAHEIQNPLNFVNNFSEVSMELLDELKEEAEAGHTEDVIAIADDLSGNLEKIRHHGKRADAIVKGMLQHSRTSSGQKEPTDLNALADEYLRLSYHGLRAKDKNFNAELITHFDEKLPKINVIPQDIGRVFLNIINNAFYATQQKAKTTETSYKPTVELSTVQQNGSVIISVKDNGTGMPDAIKDKIMQPFFTTKPTGEGTGLGLSLSYDIVVKGHGGAVQANSKEGEGSEFIIKIPLS